MLEKGSVCEVINVGQSECDTHFFSSCILVLTIQTGFIRELVTKAERETERQREGWGGDQKDAG